MVHENQAVRLKSNAHMSLVQMAEDNTPTVTARRRRPTELMRIRLESARRLQSLNAKTRAKRTAAREQKQRGDEGNRREIEIAPRVPKIKKNKLSQPPRPESRFQKRQRSKTWLPTHVFHAKRAHMLPLWRFALPLSPTEKSYRPTHRTSRARGAIVWDTSYTSTIQLEGTASALEAVLRAIGINGVEAWGPKGRSWRSGTRSLETWTLEKRDDDPKSPIAPVVLIWRPCLTSPEEQDAAEMKDKKKERRRQQQQSRVFVRVHPSAFLQLWNDILQVAKRQNPPVMVEDLRFEIGSIQITGPGSTEALLGTLHPVTEDASSSSSAPDSPESTWSSLLGVTNPSSLPQNAILAFSITDPRLRFPPRKLNIPMMNDDMYMNDLAALLSSWPPDKTQNPAALFDRPTRLAAIRNLPSQKAINRRRTLMGPGRYPPSQPADPKIPIILFTSRPTSSGSLPGSWTLLLPWKCVLPVWYSLMYYPLSSGGNPIFGGIKEQQQLAFESGVPWFPGDFPGTRAGWEWNQRENDEAREAWQRRPKGRRVEFESLDLGNGDRKGEVGLGWACDWERLVQGPQPDPVQAENGKAKKQNGKGKGKGKRKRKGGGHEKGDTTANDNNDDDNEVLEENAPSNSMPSPPPLDIHQLTPNTADVHVSNPSSWPTLSRSALACVKISLLDRGTPIPRARIYRLPSADANLRNKWIDQQQQGKGKRHTKKEPRLTKQHQRQQAEDTTLLSRGQSRQRLAASLLSDDLLSREDRRQHLPIPSEEDLIGFVTTGNFNLSEGKGTGIGSILPYKVLQDNNNDDSRGKNKEKRDEKNRRLCIVRGAGERVGRLGTWDIV